ncbi:hypothetical protein [Paenibacillus sp. FSL W8-0194]|uniref:hypothetical protein n=1 Tax=Paenibacillus sp. FSL W8-0194 TaxID=2921711 RepID=UPI0030D95FFE
MAYDVRMLTVPGGRYRAALLVQIVGSSSVPILHRLMAVSAPAVLDAVSVPEEKSAG